jgi:hypothetical protein
MKGGTFYEKRTSSISRLSTPGHEAGVSGTIATMYKWYSVTYACLTLVKGRNMGILLPTEKSPEN